jgi:hypothetical protein
MSGLSERDVERLAEALRGAGLSDNPAEFGSDIHSWRCRYPDIYGPCGCFAEVVNDLAPVVAAIRAETWDEGLHDALYARDNGDPVPPNPYRRHQA